MDIGRRADQHDIDIVTLKHFTVIHVIVSAGNLFRLIQLHHAVLNQSLGLQLYRIKLV